MTYYSVLVPRAASLPQRAIEIRHHRLLAATGAWLPVFLGADGDGQLGNFGALGTPDQDGSTTTKSHKAVEVFTTGQTTGCTLKEFGLETIVTLLVLLPVHIPASNRIFQIL